MAVELEPLSLCYRPWDKKVGRLAGVLQDESGSPKEPDQRSREMSPWVKHLPFQVLGTWA